MTFRVALLLTKVKQKCKIPNNLQKGISRRITTYKLSFTPVNQKHLSSFSKTKLLCN